MRQSSSSAAVIFVLFTLSAGMQAKDRQKQAPRSAQDEIRVVAHLAAAGDSISKFVCTEHQSRDYLYAEGEGGRFVRLIDVTNAQHPAVVADMSSALVQNESVVAAAGTAALVGNEGDNDGSSSHTTTGPEPRTFRILSFADPAHPVVKQEFSGVRAMQRDADRGLIYLANADGLWILQQAIAPDPQVEKQWEHDVLGNH